MFRHPLLFQLTFEEKKVVKIFAYSKFITRFEPPNPQNMNNSIHTCTNYSDLVEWFWIVGKQSRICLSKSKFGRQFMEKVSPSLELYLRIIKCIGLMGAYNKSYIAKFFMLFHLCIIIN